MRYFNILLLLLTLSLWNPVFTLRRHSQPATFWRLNPHLWLPSTSWPAQLQGCGADKTFRLLCVFPVFSSSLLCSLCPFIFLLVFREFSIYLEKVSFVLTKDMKVYFVKTAGIPGLSGGSKVSQFWKKKSFIQLHLWVFIVEFIKHFCHK